MANKIRRVVTGHGANGKSVLVPPAFGSYGTLGPNVFRGFPFYNWDLSVTKMWKFKERLTAQFRAEFFNIFNRLFLAMPAVSFQHPLLPVTQGLYGGNVYNTTGFGSITTLGAGALAGQRSGQLVARFTF